MKGCALRGYLQRMKLPEELPEAQGPLYLRKELLVIRIRLQYIILTEKLLPTGRRLKCTAVSIVARML